MTFTLSSEKSNATINKENENPQTNGDKTEKSETGKFSNESPKSKKEKDEEEEAWLQVKRKNKENKGKKEQKPKPFEFEREELEFHFDEELENVPIGRQNTFTTEWYVFKLTKFI